MMRRFRHTDLRVREQPGVIKLLIEIDKSPVRFETRQHQARFSLTDSILHVLQMLCIWRELRIRSSVLPQPFLDQFQMRSVQVSERRLVGTIASYRVEY